MRPAKDTSCGILISNAPVDLPGLPPRFSKCILGIVKCGLRSPRFESKVGSEEIRFRRIGENVRHAGYHGNARENGQ
jgi:hypothetical protein